MRRLRAVWTTSFSSGSKSSALYSGSCQPIHSQPVLSPLPSSSMYASIGFPRESFVPQSELPVAGSVGVPVGQRLDPALEPRALGDVGGEGRGRHGCGCSTRVRGCRGCVLPSIAVLTVQSGEVVVLLVRRKKETPIGCAGPGLLFSRPHSDSSPSSDV